MRQNRVGWALLGLLVALGCVRGARAGTLPPEAVDLGQVRAEVAVKNLADGRFELAQVSVPGAQSAGRPSPIHYPGGGNTNVCNGVFLSVSYDGNDANCANQVSYGSAGAVPTLSSSAGALSGAGATFTTADDLTGKMIYFATATPRLTNAGLTVEPAATNFELQSNDLANGVYYFTYQGTTVATTDITGRDGTNSAFKMTASNQYTNNHHNADAVITGLTTYTMAADCHAGTVSACTLAPTDSTGSAHAVVNLSPTDCTLGEVGNYLFTNVSATAIEKNNGWCHATLTFTTINTTTALQDQLWVGDGTTGIDYTPGYVYVQNVSLNAGKPISYLPTVNAAVTKAADALTVTCPAGCTGSFGGVVYGNHQNAYVNFASGSLDLIALNGAWNGYPIGRIYSSTTQPIPQPAVLAGYKTLTLATTCFTPQNVDINGTFGPGYEWYLSNFSGYGAGSAANSSLPGDCTLLVGQGTNSFNATFSTAGSLGGSNFRGRGFGGGYYAEAVFKLNTGLTFNANGSDSQQSGWPSWWSTSLKMQNCQSGAYWPGQSPAYVASPCNVGYTNYLEFDIYEHFPPLLFNTALLSFETTDIHWYNVCCTCPGSCYAKNQENILYKDTSDAATYHSYGFLWVPATDVLPGVTLFTYDGVVIFKRVFTKWTGQAPPPSDSTPWGFGLSDDVQTLIVGSGYNSVLNSTSPYMIMKSVKVWQLDTSKDVIIP